MNYREYFSNYYTSEPTDYLLERVQPEVQYTSLRIEGKGWGKCCRGFRINDLAQTRLRNLEESQSANLSWIALTVGLPRELIHQWKRGEKKIIHIEDAIKINEYCGQAFKCTIFDIPSRTATFTFFKIDEKISEGIKRYIEK